jgi:hypothetical protein
MQTRSSLTTLALALCVFASNASAATILVGTWDSPNSGEATENASARTAIANYNSANDPDLSLLYGAGSPPPLLAGWVEFDKIELNNGPHTFTFSPTGIYAGYTEYYVVSKYGNPNNSRGANFDTALHHLLNGDSISYNPGGSSAPNGLSHYRIWARGGSTQVPDGGSTVLLLGLGLSGLALLRRRKS